ncbi:MAG: Nramp family divalent metal transporter [Chitinophagaceae bacterium]|nr:Nramp family divalent metal transporter [Chitinophagaceae bacterium]MBP6589988.1 Nramp family divalent metal transporter [Chitinophagaceae bacterium]
MKDDRYNYTSLSEVHQSVDTTSSKRKGWRKSLAFLGPAYLVSVGYMDPGNWATDLAGGSQFGYKLIWVLLMSNLMALLLQSLSARLGIVRGRDLAQANRETYPRYINYALYGLAEIAIAATDLAEILGMAIGIQLLTGLPLIWGVSITVLDTFLFLLLQRLGMRKMEAFIIALVAVIGLSFLIEIIIAKPDLGEVVKGFVPSIPNNTALYIAIGIIGATVMPHNLYLHSALVQTRKIKRDDAGIKRALKLNFIDSAIALNLAFFVNAAILVLAATVFFKTGRTDVAEIKQAHELLAPMLGSGLAPILFAVALIASGQSSTITGTLAGQIVMEGYLHLRINPMVRRLLTRVIAIIPAVLVILINGENNIDSLLVLSQVILSLQLGFAIIPLIHFTSDKKTMGKFAIKPLVIATASLITVILVYLNIRMVLEQAGTFFETSSNLFWKAVIILGGIFYLVLLIVAIFYPLRKKIIPAPSKQLHSDAALLDAIETPVYNQIAIALDFSKDDARLIAHALGQGNSQTNYILIHVVESATTRLMEKDTDDLETRKDQEQLNHYVQQLQDKGHQAKGLLGFNERAKEIARIARESGAEMLVIGAHGHSGIRDIIYGQTVDAVRHELKIPVLVVNV